MIFRIVLTAAIAGLVAGLLVTAAQAVRIVPLILAAEKYEQAAPAAPKHSHSDAAAGHSHAHESWSPIDGWERIFYTLLANFLTAVAYAALLASAFTVYGKPVSPAGSVAWSLAGFAAFSFIPAMGLPPELPGMVAGDLAARQIWWWSSVVANCAGLAALFFARGRIWKGAGGILIALPFVFGPPHAPDTVGAGAVPPELAAQFVVASLGTALLFWLVLGLSTACVFSRVRQARVQARVIP